MVTQSEGTAKRPLSPTLIWLTLGFFLLFFGAAQQQFQSPFFEDSLGWSPVRRSGILAVVYFTFGFGRLAAGHWILRWGEKPMLLVGAATYGVFCLAIYAWAPYYPLLLLAAALWGLGAAVNWGTSAQLMLDAARDGRYGGSAGLVMGATRLGFALGVVALAKVFDAHLAAGGALAGRNVWLVSAGATVLALLALSQIPARRVELVPPTLAGHLATWRSTFGAIGGLFLFLGGFAFAVMLGLIADMLAKGFPGGSAIAVTAWFSVAGFAVNVVGGPLSDRVGRPLTLFASFIAGAAGLVLPIVFPQSLVALSLCSLLLGLQAGLVPTMTIAMIGDAFASEQRQNVYGALFFWRDMGVAGSLLGSQWLKSAVPLPVALGVLALLSAGCALLCLPLARQLEAREADR